MPKEYKVVFVENKTTFVTAESRDEAIDLVSKSISYEDIKPNLTTYLKVEEVEDASRGATD